MTQRCYRLLGLHRKTWLTLFFVFGFWPAIVFASCPEPDPGVDVAVGIREAPPFIVEDAIRGQRGFAIELWRSIERELQDRNVIGETQLIDCPLADQLEALEKGKLDLVISPLTITADRMAAFDFTQQYLGSGITVAHRNLDVIDFSYAGRIIHDTFSQTGVPFAVLLFLAVNLLLVALVYMALKSHVDFEVINREPALVRWFRAGVETLVRTTGLYGMGSEFRSTAAKTLEAVMAVIGILLSATIFGVLTAALIGSVGSAGDITLGELSELRVATLASSTSQDFVENLNQYAGSIGYQEESSGGVEASRTGRRISLSAMDNQSDPLVGSGNGQEAFTCRSVDNSGARGRCLTTESWADAMVLLARGEVDVVVGDWAQLSFLARRTGIARDIQVQSSAFRNEPYGWGVSPDRPELRAVVDHALMERLRHPQWRYLVQEYLGSGSIGTN
ncbi:MAG: transporter substrate-binding domain-containing protein [Alteromonadaceae bacterium]|nr:transporter substrate-binding domain-containing protein [Alteromonadaceae bacterium]